MEEQHQAISTILYSLYCETFEPQKHWPEINDHNTYSVSFSYDDQQDGHTEPCTSGEEDANHSAYCEEDGSSLSVTRGHKRKRSPHSTAKSWKTENDPDICPPPNRFVPARPPGHQLNSNNKHMPLDLFKLFLSNEAISTLCENTNKQAAKNIGKGKKYSWTDLDVPEFLNYVRLTFFFSLVKLDNICDYWKKNTIFSVLFPADVMSQDRYRVISWNIHMSDPEEDVENDRQKGTPQYDHLFRLNPLMDTIKHACNTFYHPRQKLLIDERTIVRKNHAGMIQKGTAKPNKLGFKLFVLSDSSNGYILDFAVYTGKSRFESGTGLAYDSVMTLIKSAHLGSGYNLFLDSFYTSPKLFRDLLSLNVGACGTYRDNRRGCPTTHSNALTKKDPKGTLRWIREPPVVYVKWKDFCEVSICSTVHQAFSGHTVERRVKSEDGKLTVGFIPCPTPVMEYNKYMGGADMLEQLTQSYSVHHKTSRWYRLLFLHFLEIAATNSFLLHKELCREKHEEPMTHRAFLEELTAQLCGVTVAVPPTKGPSGHLPVPISNQPDASKRASYGRRTCVQCRLIKKEYQSTPWKCRECDVALCLIADRNCFEAWHE